MRSEGLTIGVDPKAPPFLFKSGKVVCTGSEELGPDQVRPIDTVYRRYARYR
jgi:TATA-box binding protein (TBP) (component of TFIID and TFIIIB)